MSINTNVMSLNAQRNLTTSASQLATSLQRLSSGLRINSAKDDAAGLAISERFTTQIRGLTQAARNANDGISLAQTTEGALSEVTNNLQRIRELAVQSANATNSTSDRAALDNEVQQRLAEVERIAQQTNFNGQKVLDGSFGTATFQVGANVGETIAINLSTSTRTSAIGKTADYVGASTYNSSLAVGQQGTGVSGAAIAANSLTLAVGSAQAVSIAASVAGTATGQTNSSAYAKAAAINSSGVAGLSATADTTAEINFATVTGNSYTLAVNGTNIFSAQDFSSTNLTGSGLASQINANTSATGVSASFASGKLTLSASDGRNIAVTQTLGATATASEGLTTAGSNNNSVNVHDFTTAQGATNTFSLVGSVRLNSADTITVGGTAAPIGYAAGQLSLGAAALSSASVTTVANANTTITRIDAALSAVSSLRSSLGAMQSRFESTITNLQTTTENLSASRGRIQDTDFAAETANLTKAQILHQAGTAILAQANAVPQSVLSLLK
jgi:flagellin